VHRHKPMAYIPELARGKYSYKVTWDSECSQGLFPWHTLYSSSDVVSSATSLKRTHTHTQLRLETFWFVCLFKNPELRRCFLHRTQNGVGCAGRLHTSEGNALMRQLALGQGEHILNSDDQTTTTSHQSLPATTRDADSGCWFKEIRFESSCKKNTLYSILVTAVYLPYVNCVYVN